MRCAFCREEVDPRNCAREGDLVACLPCARTIVEELRSERGTNGIERREEGGESG